MQNTDNNVFSFFYPGGNETLLSQPIGISTYEDVISLIELLKNQDFLQHVHLQRPNTKYRVVHITNVLYTTYNRGHVIGSDEIVLPSYILKKKSIISLVKSSHGTPYNNHCCMFRALAVQREGTKSAKENVKQLFSLLKTSETRKTFKGVKIEDEEIYNINVNIYELNKNDSVTTIHNSCGLRQETLYLNKHLNHVSLIKEFSTYAKKFCCKLCKREFDHSTRWKEHEKVCDQSTRFKYPGGYYSLGKNVFQLLEELNIYVSKEKRYCEHFAVYNMESKLVTSNQEVGEKTTILSQHYPISASICSTVEKKAVCFISDNPTELVSQMMVQFSTIQDTVSKQMLSRFRDVFQLLNDYKDACSVKVCN